MRHWTEQDIAAEREVAEALQLLDHPVPSVDPAQVIARARIMEGEAIAPTRTVRHSRLWWGAGLMTFGIAVVAAAVVPRSPVRQLVMRMWSAATATQETGVAPVPRAQQPSLAPSLPGASRGVAIAADRSVDVVFRIRQPAGVIRIVARPDARISVTANGDGATYTVGRDTIVVDNRRVDSLSYDVAVPSAALLPTVRVHVGTRVVYSRREGVEGIHDVPFIDRGHQSGDHMPGTIPFSQLPR